MQMFQFSDRMSAVAISIVAITLISMVVTILIPVGVLFGGRRKATQPTGKIDRKADGVVKSVPESNSYDDIDSIDGDIEVAEAQDESFDLDESAVTRDSLSNIDNSELNIPTSEFQSIDSFDEFEEHDAEIDLDTQSVEEFEGIDLDDDIEEEPKPKKKKR